MRSRTSTSTTGANVLPPSTRRCSSGFSELAGGGREHVAGSSTAASRSTVGDRHAALMHHAARLRGEGLGRESDPGRARGARRRFTDQTGRAGEIDGIVRWVMGKQAPPPLDPVDVELLALLDELPTAPVATPRRAPRPPRRRGRWSGSRISAIAAERRRVR